MKITTIHYSRLVNTGGFENVRIGVDAELSEGETAIGAFEKAKEFVETRLPKSALIANTEAKPIPGKAAVAAEPAKAAPTPVKADDEDLAEPAKPKTRGRPAAAAAKAEPVPAAKAEPAPAGDVPDEKAIAKLRADVAAIQDSHADTTAAYGVTRELLSLYGVKKLSALPAKDRAEFLARLKRDVAALSGASAAEEDDDLFS